jgi:hypothetical protein
VTRNLSADRRFNRRLEYITAALISDWDIVPRLCESRPLGAHAMSDELSVVLRFLAGLALAPQDVVGRKLSG